MEFKRIKKYLEKHGEEEDEDAKMEKVGFDSFIISGVHRDLIEPGRVLCSFKIPPRLLNSENNSLHGGAIASMVDLVGSAVIAGLGHIPTGVSVEINVSFVDAAILTDEIEIEATEVRIGKSIGVVNVELRNKATGKIIAYGRHTKYLPAKSKL